MTDQEILTQLQYSLMEPPDNGATWPSGLWTQAEVLAALNERQNRFLKRTGIEVGQANIAVSIGTFRYALPQDWLATLGVVWLGPDGTQVSLSRSDAFEADHGLADWPTTYGTPLLWMDADAPLLELQIAPLPNVAGNLLLLYIPQGAALDATGELFTIPNEYVHAVGKYGALADLFGKDGRGQNPEKAQYAELRYSMAEQMSQILLRGWV